MNEMILGIIGIAVIIGLLIIFKFYSKEIKNDNNDKIKLYYRYAGDIEWIECEIKKYRFASLKYLLSCKNKEDSDFQIVINKIENGMNVAFYATEFNYSKKSFLECIVEGLELNDEKYLELLKNLKDTYIEDDQEGEITKKIKRNNEKNIKEIIE